MSGLTVTRLRLSTTWRGSTVVDDTSLTVDAGEIVGLVGESGSGKTSIGLATLGSARAGMVFAGGAVRVGDDSVLDLADEGLRRVRGARISYMSQRPSAALNPALTIGAQFTTVLRSHQLDRGTTGRERVARVCDEVALPAALLARYPHQLSGGQLRRAALAVALVCDPEVVVLDEPSVGLDPATASHVLAAIRRRCDDHGMAALWITHDLAMARAVTDRIYVMYAGSVVEEGPTAALADDPAHPYTRHLLAAVPDPTGERRMIGLPGRAPGPGHRPAGCRFAPRCTLARDECMHALPSLAELGAARRARCVVPFAVPDSLLAVASTGPPPDAGREVLLGLRSVSASYHGVRAVDDVTLDVEQGEWLAVVGPSGSGKTTLLRTIAGIHRRPTGSIELCGEALAPSVRRRTAAQRRAIQIVLQHPHASFNPRRTIGQSVGRSLRLTGATRDDARVSTREAMARVALDAEIVDRYPDELSGGELQRAAIARAVACGPNVLLCDEVTSSLDSVVQAAIVELLAGLGRDLGLTIVFVTHDLALVAAVADRTAVMAGGRLVGVSPLGVDHPARGGSRPPGDGR